MADHDAVDGSGDRILGAVGLAVRGGRAAVGTRSTLDAAASGELELIVLASDATRNAEKRLGRALRSTPTLRPAAKADLGRAVGRGPTAVVGITDPGLAARIRELAAAAGREDGVDGPTDASAGGYETERSMRTT